MRVAKSVFGFASVSVSGKSDPAANANKPNIPATGAKKAAQSSKLGPTKRSFPTPLAPPFPAVTFFFCESGILLH